MRLHILDEHVDKFILTESPETFSGLDKPLYYQDNKERFAKWNHKIIHNVVPKFETNDIFARSFHQKEDASKYFTDNDKVYFGDVDEIWQPTEGYGRIHQYNYSYYLNQRSSEDWYGTVTGTWKELKQGLNWNRANAPKLQRYNSWHFTNMGGIEKIMKKVDSYDHAWEVQQGGYRDKIRGQFEANKDYLGREADWLGNPFTFWLDESTWPQYLKENHEQYQHLCK